MSVVLSVPLPHGRHDTAARRQSKRSGREGGCWTYIPAELLRKAGFAPDDPAPFYRVWGGMLVAILGGRAYGRTTCANWSNETGIRTKFVILNWADSGTCLAQTPDGRWVLNSRWQAFVTGGKR